MNNLQEQRDIIIGIGEILWDVLPEGKTIGGAPANFAYHISQFGLHSCAVSAVGDDAPGNEILNSLKEKDVNYIIPQVDFPTGTVNIQLDDAGIPRYEIADNVAWDNIPFTSRLEALTHRTKAVCFGSLAQRHDTSRLTIRRFIEAIPQTADNLIVFDANLRQDFYTRDTLCESMKLCNVLKINDDEIAILAAMHGYANMDYFHISEALMNHYDIGILILTCGIRGSYVYTRGDKSFFPTPEVCVADTVGAGDSFTAAFIAGMIKGKSVSESHACAVNTSAFVCTMKGAMPTLPFELTNG